MSYFIPDSCLLCENCRETFFSYVTVANVINADGSDENAQNVRSGFFNRVECPFCNCEFTVEVPLLLYTEVFKTYAAAAFSEDNYMIGSLENALRISASGDLNLRKCDFAMEAAEKIRIVIHGFDDAKIEFFKLKKFPEYKDMENDDRFIMFDELKGDKMIFTYRHFTDNVIDTYEVLRSEYDSFNPEIPKIPTGVWFKADKAWALKCMEESK